jgi:hypothetical protein
MKVKVKVRDSLVKLASWERRSDWPLTSASKYRS